jgi:hypothetical protein
MAKRANHETDETSAKREMGNVQDKHNFKSLTV